MSYHNRNIPLSYNAILYFIVLRRGKGKSYGYKDLCISDYINGKGQFIYVRRYKSELKDSKNEFFEDIKNKYPDHKFKVVGNKFYCDDKICGYAMALSVISQSKSRAFPNVRNLMFDEFIPEDENVRYLPNEGKAFSSLLSTVFRDRKIRAFLIGNKVSSITPYNIYFNLPTFDRNFYDKKRKILIFSEEEETEKEENKKVTDLETILKGTEYYNYNFKNESLKDDKSFIKKRTNDSELKFIMLIKNKYVGMYIDKKEGLIFFDTNTDLTFPIKFSFDIYNLKEAHLLFDKNNNYAKMINKLLHYGGVYYSNLETKLLLEDFIKYIK